MCGHVLCAPAAAAVPRGGAGIDGRVGEQEGTRCRWFVCGPSVRVLLQKAEPGPYWDALLRAKLVQCKVDWQSWIDEDEETVIADLTRLGDRALLAKGGNGGFGNLHFKTSVQRAPRRANPGQEAVERTLWLRLKLIADAGLAGLPNAGKSTFLAAVSNARPKIADYPFTTLHPNLGVAGVDDTELVIADIPGLIEGASEGRGLGDQFLGHIERCAVLLHLIDATGEDVVADWKVIRAELEAYGAGIADKPCVTALNKIDALTEEELEEKLAALTEAGAERVLSMSGVAGTNVLEALRRLRREVMAKRRADAGVDEDGRMAEDEPWRP